MNINYYLKDNQATNDTLVMLHVSLNGQRHKYSTKLKINPKHWNKSTQKAKSSFPNSTNFNVMLTSIESKVNDLYTNNFVMQNASISKFLDGVKEYLNRKSEKSNLEKKFLEIFEKFIEAKKNIVSEATIATYITTRNHIKSYSISINKDLQFKDIDLHFYDNFLNFIRSNNKQKTNTWSKHIKIIKAFMQYSLDRNYHNNLEFKKFERKHEKGEFVYFGKQDFDKILNLDLTHEIGLDKTRRLFCISCLTGLRFSDVININYNNIINGKYNLGVVKKNTPMKIEMTDIAIKYIKQYFDLYGIGGGFTSQTSNKHLTKILMKAEVDKEELLFKRNYLGVLEEVRKPLYEWITFHYGRRYFIIQCLEKGMEPLMIMKITGHEDYTVFKGYVKFSEDDSVRKLNDAWGESY